MREFEGMEATARRIKKSGRFPPCRNTREIAEMAGVSYSVMVDMIKDDKLSPPECSRRDSAVIKSNWYSLPDVVAWLKSEIVMARIESYLMKVNKKS